MDRPALRGSSSLQPTYSPTTNRMTLLPGGFVPSYDANGNVLNDSSHQYTWDAEARPVSIDSVGLTYDALGRMVEQNRSSIYTELVYGPNGDKLALMNGQTVQEAFVPLPGNAVAVYNSTGLDHYRHPDWLGSSRFASTSARGMYFDVAYAPFGEPYAQSGTTDLSFTGQNQDTVGGGLTGLYDFPAREYSTQGRWPSPDPGGLGAVVFSDPQTLNRYAYVRNGPLTLTDPSGMYAFGDWPFAFNFGGFPLGGFLWNPNGIGSNIGRTWGEQSPWGLPLPPWLTSSGIDWTTLALGRPDLSKFIINDWADKECADVWLILKVVCQNVVANTWKKEDQGLQDQALKYLKRFGSFGPCSAEMEVINSTQITP
ncbi:MAG: hypothetical protein DMG28_07675 [Acidobacteria bacterium]|nr:MAG: hypothetical protein DMG28_07675 [Acidobacteriota bacterium]